MQMVRVRRMLSMLGVSRHGRDGIDPAFEDAQAEGWM
jgi:hypothetical protein